MRQRHQFPTSKHDDRYTDARPFRRCRVRFTQDQDAQCQAQTYVHAAQPRLVRVDGEVSIVVVFIFSFFLFSFVFAARCIHITRIFLVLTTACLLPVCLCVGMSRQTTGEFLKRIILK